MASPYTSQPDDTTGVDCYIINGIYANTNTGTSTAIQIGENGGFIARGLIKFPGLSDGSIESYATIQSVVFSLWFKSDQSSNARTVRVYRMKHSWTEAGATYNKYDGSNNWPGGAGAFGAADCEQTDIGTASVGAAETLNTEKQWSLSASAIQEMVSGAFTNNGFMIKVDTETSDQYDYHSSGGATSGYRPKIVVTYSLGGRITLWSST